MDNETVTDTDHILEAEALLQRAQDHLRIVAGRCHTRDRKADVMRQLRQQARTTQTAPALRTQEPLDLAG